jgi:hypothetical protein
MALKLNIPIAATARAKQQLPSEQVIAPPVALNTSNNEPAAAEAQPIAPITEISLASQAISERLSSIAAALLTANPDITNDLHFIHRAILEDPAQVTMMTEEQKITFFAGLKYKTGAEIIATTAKSKQASSKKLAALSVDDLL